MSDTTLEPDVLKHYGVPGMKWGVRRADGSYKNLGRAQKKYDKELSKTKSYIKVHNAAAQDVNSGKSPLIRNTNKKLATLLKREGVKSIDAIRSESGLKAYDKIVADYDRQFGSLMQKKVVEIFGERPF